MNKQDQIEVAASRAYQIFTTDQLTGRNRLYQDNHNDGSTGPRTLKNFAKRIFAGEKLVNPELIRYFNGHTKEGLSPSGLTLAIYFEEAVNQAQEETEAGVHGPDCKCTRCEWRRNSSGLTGKSPRLTARVSEAEAEAAKAAAKEAGLSVSEWLRKLIQESA